MIWYRRIVQIVCFALFAFAVAVPLGGIPVKLFFQTDPLSTAVATRHVIFVTALVLTGGLVVLTLLLGRVFCGWACPLGAMADLIDYLTGFPVRAATLRGAKYHILIVLGCLAVFGVSFFWILDPLNLAARLTSVFSLRITEPGWVLIIGLGFLLVALAAGRRGFCRILCPLGALLGVVTRLSLFKRTLADSCVTCGACQTSCKTGAIGSTPSRFEPTECIHCRLCDHVCPEHAITFSYAHHRPQSLHVSRLRRSYLASLAVGAVAVPVARYMAPTKLPRPTLRPPGTVDEKRLQNLCTRCGSCMRVCPTASIVSKDDTGIATVWMTPEFVPRNGGCLYDCNACGGECPTGAIANLPLDEKNRQKIGLAKIHHQSCVAHAEDKACLACQAACPVEAIELTATQTRLSWNDPLWIPQVDKEKCTGCGLCEAACPVQGEAAIEIAAIRS